MQRPSIALEFDGLARDPLEIAKDTDLRAGESWALLAGDKTLAVYVLGPPEGGVPRGFIFCADRAGERDCMRIAQDGTLIARVVGPWNPEGNPQTNPEGS